MFSSGIQRLYIRTDLQGAVTVFKYQFYNRKHLLKGRFLKHAHGSESFCVKTISMINFRQIQKKGSIATLK